MARQKHTKNNGNENDQTVRKKPQKDWFSIA